jgi:serine/threonine protein kinase
MIVGLRYMHSLGNFKKLKLGIIHRDLKPENIMVSYENKEIDKIKIIDFGFANYLETLLELPPECKMLI